MAQTENLTVMFTDIVGFTERTSRQSRAQNMAMLRDHNQILLPLTQCNRALLGCLVSLDDIDERAFRRHLRRGGRN